MIKPLTKAFYEIYPFPKKINIESQIKTTWAWLDILLFDKLKLPKDYLRGKKVLDVGCGTGEKCLYFYEKGAIVTGIDQSSSSCKLAKKLLGNKAEIITTQIECLDLKEEFDFIFSYGVLHHSTNPKSNFDIICKFLKKEGYIFLNLYSYYGWLLGSRLRLNKKIMKMFPNDKDIDKRIDYAIKSKPYEKIWSNLGNDKRTWYMDHFCNRQSTHTFKEVIGWFNENNVEFYNSFPDRFGKNNKFIPRTLNQIEMLLRTGVKMDINVLGRKK